MERRRSVEQRAVPRMRKYLLQTQVGEINYPDEEVGILYARPEEILEIHSTSVHDAKGNLQTDEAEIARLRAESKKTARSGR